MRSMIALADDLSGAAETAAVFLAAVANTSSRAAHTAQSGEFGAESIDGAPQLFLLPSPTKEVGPAVRQLVAGRNRVDAPRPLVLDTNNRSHTASDAADRLRQVLAALPAGAPDPTLFLKLDSLLRGPVAPQLQVLAETGAVLLAPALPPMGRSTVEGTVHHNGVPLHWTRLWHAEPAPPPVSIAAALQPLPTMHLDLATVRSGAAGLCAALHKAASGTPRPVIICDAETAADLDALVEAGRSLPTLRYAGASALGAALARSRGRLSAEPAAVGHRVTSARPAGVNPLLIVGSASASAREQLAVLDAAGVPVLTLCPADLLAGTVDPASLAQALACGPAAVTMDAAAVDPRLSARLVSTLAQTVCAAALNRPLMLTGGETARAVLDALGVSELHVVAEIEHGAVLSQTPAGIPIVTRPGSFGTSESLRTILATLVAAASSLTENSLITPVVAAPQPTLPGKGSS